MSGVRAQPPILPAPVPPHMPPIRRVQLRCGVDCWIVEQRELPVVDVRILIRRGALLDPPPLAGRAWLLSELLDQGTTSRSATRIADEVELLGASLQTRATWDAVALALHVLVPRLDAALDILADVALQPAFADAELERKRRERLAAIMQEHDDPRVLASLAFQRVAYGGDPFGAPLGGTRDSVAALTADQVRALYAELFTPRNAALIIVGDIPAEQALRRAEALFGAWSSAAGAAAPATVSLPMPPRAVHIVDRPGAPQSELRVGHAGPQRATADYFPLLVANTVLGGAFTSRLNLRLREEKAYTYGAGSRFALRAGGGPFVASTAVATSATADSIHVMIHEIERLVHEAVPEPELERAREYLVLGLARTFETTADVAEHVGEMALHGLPEDWYDGFAAAVRAVTASDVQRAAAAWLRPDHLTIAVAGDAAAVREEIELLNIGAVHVHESI